MKKKLFILLLLFLGNTAIISGRDSLEVYQQNLDILSTQRESNLSENSKEVTLLRQDIESIKADTKKYLLIAILAVILVIFVAVQAIILYLRNANTQKLNISLTKKHHDSQEQNEEIKQQNEEIRQQNEEIASINEHLEKMVLERTKELQYTIESLSNRNQDLEQFSYIISHQVRAPIARLIGLTNIFDKEDITNPINQAILGHTQQSAKDLDTIIKDLAHTLSIKNGVNLKKELFDFKKMTNEVLENLQTEIDEAQPQIRLNIDAEEQIFSVKNYWESIVYNLVSNAIKFRKNRGKLQIDIDMLVHNKVITLSIKDNGLGLDLKQIDNYKIFGLYQRMHTHVVGKGLGLYIAKTQVEAFGGKIEVQSIENVGSTFSVIVPIWQ